MRLLRLCPAILLGDLLAAACQRAPMPAAQEATLEFEVIARGPACATCSLDFDYTGRLGGPADSVVLSAETVIGVRPDGTFLAAPTMQDGEGAVFDSIGSIARSYGRLGEGPGENGRILGVFPWHGDTILFAGFDRLTFVAGPAGKGRTVRLERPSPSHRTVILPEDGVVVRNYAYPPDHQFVVFEADGRVRTQLGEQVDPGTDVYKALGELGNASDPHHFWSAPQRYGIEFNLWDAREGRLLRSLHDTAPWYAAHDSAALYRFIVDGNDSENPPPPFLRGIRETAGKTLLAVYNVAARDWAPFRDTLPPAQRRYRRQAYDGVLEYRDPETGEVLLSAWVNLPFARLINDTLVADRLQTAEGFWVYDIYKVVLRR